MYPSLLPASLLSQLSVPAASAKLETTAGPPAAGEQEGEGWAGVKREAVAPGERSSLPMARIFC